MNITTNKNGYYLISKITGKNFVDYKSNLSVLIKNIPMTVDEIIIGNINNPKERRKIITFKDSNGKIIQRIFDYKKKPLRFNLYEYDDYVIGENEWVNKTSIKEYSLKRSFLGVFEELRHILGWNQANNIISKKGKTKHNFLSENISNKQLSKILSSIIITPQKQKEKHQFIEFAKRKNPRKIELTVDNGTFKVTTRHKKLKDDEFLAIRGYDTEKTKIPLTRYFLKKLGFDNIKINTEYIPATMKEEHHLIAFFDSFDWSINFSKLHKCKSKDYLVNIIAHEIEHARQWILSARLTGGNTEQSRWIYNKLGPLTNKSEIEEAKKITDSIKSYVSFDVDMEKYKSSFIEQLAYARGDSMQKDYNSKGSLIRQLFPHIPKEAL